MDWSHKITARTIGRVKHQEVVVDVQQLLKDRLVKFLNQLNLVRVHLQSETIHTNADTDFSKVCKHRKGAQLELKYM